jgi:hypothetical protein
VAGGAAGGAGGSTGLGSWDLLAPMPGGARRRPRPPSARRSTWPDTDGYDPIADVWDVYAPMGTPRHGTGAAGVGNKLYFSRGATAQGGGTAVAILEAFTPP